MTTYIDIINRALQVLGTRTTVSVQEMQGLTSNEAIQASLLVEAVRDDVLRMAPWECAMAIENGVLICAAPGTPENTGPAPATWQRGIPTPPWAYEYAYPGDCLRFVQVLPLNYASPPGVPIYPISTGYAALPQGPSIPHKMGNERLYPIVSATPVAGGIGHAVGDCITLTAPVAGDFDPASMSSDFPTSGAPAGNSPELLVTAVAGNGSGAITAVSVIAGFAGSIYNLPSAQFDASNNAGLAGGGYFTPPLTVISQAATSGAGINATFNLTAGPRTNVRTILTNQQQATFRYIRRVIDPNSMDALLIEAWIELLAARLCMALLGDKALANQRIQLANNAITEARSVDGNEAAERVDIDPDWIRTRGFGGSPCFFDNSFNWGGLWPTV